MIALKTASWNGVVAPILIPPERAVTDSDLLSLTLTLYGHHPTNK